jgi:hypothetical protein
LTWIKTDLRGAVKAEIEAAQADVAAVLPGRATEPRGNQVRRDRSRLPAVRHCFPSIVELCRPCSKQADAPCCSLTKR